MVDKKNAIVFLIVILLALAIGYAAFSTALTINGTATSNAIWDVKFIETGFYLADGTTADNVHTCSAQIGGTGNNTITASITLKYPGDGALLKAVVKNNGNMPAKLTNFSIGPATLASDVDFEVVQAAGGPTINEILQPNGTCTATFRVKWKEGSTVTSLGTKTFTITYNYQQETTEFTGAPSHADVNP